METSSKNNNTVSEMFINFFGFDNYKSILQIIINYAKDNFQKFCALFSAISFILFWYIRTLAYCYQSGLFYAYSINSHYIDINDNFFFQLIEYFAISIIVLLSNLFLLKLHTSKSKRIIRIIYKLIFFTIETLSLFFIVMFLTYSSIKQVLSEIKSYTPITYFVLLFTLIICFISVNIFAIEIIIYSNHTKPKKENTTSTESVKTYIIALVITAIIVIPLSYFMGVYNDRIRNSYKIVMEDISSQEFYPSEYKYNINNNKVHLYAVAYENDLLLLHRPDTLVEPEDVATAFDVLYESGKVRHFGVSNHKPMQIELLQKYVRQPLVVNQVQFSIPVSNLVANGMEVNMETPGSIDHDGSLLDYCRLHNITLQAWSPFQMPAWKGCFLGSDEYPELNKKLHVIAEKYNVSDTTIAAAWILRHPANMQIVTGTASESRLKEIIAACDITLTREEWYELYLAAGHLLP